MTEYLVTVAFVREPDPALLPAERERIAELTNGGDLRAAYLSADRSQAWLVLRGDGPDDARRAVESLPLYPSMAVRAIDEVRGIGPSADAAGDG